ncbi:MAG: hypothetical protein NW216_08215 [Hyphomicrobium sp.]|nr:hypothetical protein [Hyphomicrobium sp.]
MPTERAHTATFPLSARRAALDFAAGLGLYLVAAALILGSRAVAAIDAAVLGHPPASWFAFAAIGVAFAALFAFNAAITRHVHRLYVAEAKPRRKSGHKSVP